MGVHILIRNGRSRLHFVIRIVVMSHAGSDFSLLPCGLDVEEQPFLTRLFHALLWSTTVERMGWYSSPLVMITAWCVIIMLCSDGRSSETSRGFVFKSAGGVLIAIAQIHYPTGYIWDLLKLAEESQGFPDFRGLLWRASKSIDSSYTSVWNVGLISLDWLFIKKISLDWFSFGGKKKKKSNWPR